MLAFIFIPVIQKELDIFRVTVWNHKRGRKQINKILPTGIPEYIYDHPEEFDAQDCGTVLLEEQLLSTAHGTNVLDEGEIF